MHNVPSVTLRARARRGTRGAGGGAARGPVPGQPDACETGAGGARGSGAQENGGQPGRAQPDLPRVVLGTVLDVSPHVLVVRRGGRAERLALTGAVTVWRAEPVPPTALRQGEPVVVRTVPGRPNVAGKVWASIGRVTGTIVSRRQSRLLVDEGATRPRQTVVISPRAESRIRVRLPHLEHGSLIDVIGVRRGEVLEAHLPATAQPAYLAGRVNRTLTTPRPTAGPFSGSATWREPATPGEESPGAAYPAIDPSSGCAEHAMTSPASGVLPYLAVGSLLRVRNDCTGASAVLPVTGCCAVAAHFHDRCLACGTSPRGRIAELTVTSFVALGGELERGCFNATVDAGW